MLHNWQLEQNEDISMGLIHNTIIFFWKIAFENGISIMTIMTILFQSRYVNMIVEISWQIKSEFPLSYQMTAFVVSVCRVCTGKHHSHVLRLDMPCLWTVYITPRHVSHQIWARCSWAFRWRYFIVLAKSCVIFVHFLPCRFPGIGAINSLRPSDSIWRHRSDSTLVQVMAWCRQATMLTYHQLGLLSFVWGKFHKRFLNHHSLK